MIWEILQSIKETILDYIKHRLFPITVLIIVMFVMLIKQLFTLQIVEGEKHMENFTYKSKKTLTIESVRGEIYDRNGKLLAYNELAYSVVFSNDTAITAAAAAKGVSENALKNEILYRAITILENNNDDLAIDFNITLDEKGEYKFLVKETQL
ncbi:MAG: hypothetical protein J6A59_17170, partial [Lachnospiraceae bacterium]|nr:hypothetical protein [Lachnospiraceae bacterium]